MQTLLQPYRRFLSESSWLLSTFEIGLVNVRSLPPADRRADLLTTEMAVIRLSDAWSRFCREVVVMSAGCKPYTLNGNRLHLVKNVSRRSDVIPHLLSYYGGPNPREPDWGVTWRCIDAAQLLKVDNIRTVSAALGAVGSPVEEIRNVRNFFAHRWKDTADRIRRQGFYRSAMRINVEDIVGSSVPPGVTRMEHWILQLRLVAEASIQ